MLPNSVKVEFVSKVLSLALSDKVGYVQVCSKIANFEFFEKVFLDCDSSQSHECSSEDLKSHECSRDSLQSHECSHDLEQKKSEQISKPVFREKCRRHGWMEGDVGYTYFERCKECYNAMNHRIYVIFKNKFPEFKFPDLDDEEQYPDMNRNIVKKPECFGAPGTLQKHVSKEELEDFYMKMEDIYPFPEEFI